MPTCYYCGEREQYKDELCRECYMHANRDDEAEEQFERELREIEFCDRRQYVRD